MRPLFLLLLVVSICYRLPAQETSQSFVQEYSPSVLLPIGQFEVRQYNNLYTQNQVNVDGSPVDLDERQTFLTSFFELTYGSDASRRWNVGFDVWLNAARYDSTRSANPLRVLSRAGATFQRTELSYVGLRLRYVPIARMPNLSFQTRLLLPLAPNPEQPRFLTHDRSSWWTQLFYDYTRGKYQLFFSGELLYRFRSGDETASNDERRGFLRLPFGVTASYFLGRKGTLFALVQHSQVHQRLPANSATTFARVRHFTQAGIGAKWQVHPQVGIEALWTKFVQARNDGLGSTLNFGIRYIR